jgi:3-hydroxyacyl-[acyl-carrier-protein] dehydratase
VLPGNRFVIAARLLQVRRGAMVVCEFQGFVNRSMVCEGIIKGIPLPANFFNDQASAVR